MTNPITDRAGGIGLEEQEQGGIPGQERATSGVREPAKAKRRPPPRRRPVDPSEGPWLIRSHYWKAWHRRSSDGGACGYETDIAKAGIFGFDKANEYHDWQIPNGRDEAIPVRRVAAELMARVRQMEAEREALEERIARLRAATASPVPEVPDVAG